MARSGEFGVTRFSGRDEAAEKRAVALGVPSTIPTGEEDRTEGNRGVVDEGETATAARRKYAATEVDQSRHRRKSDEIDVGSEGFNVDGSLTDLVRWQP
ncbi:hypothetical protein LXL04_032609 [Taraxacum kok-saghyz]